MVKQSALHRKQNLKIDIDCQEQWTHECFLDSWHSHVLGRFNLSNNVQKVLKIHLLLSSPKSQISFINDQNITKDMPYQRIRRSAVFEIFVRLAHYLSSWYTLPTFANHYFQVALGADLVPLADHQAYNIAWSIFLAVMIIWVQDYPAIHFLKQTVLIVQVPNKYLWIFI